MQRSLSYIRDHWCQFERWAKLGLSNGLSIDDSIEDTISNISFDSNTNILTFTYTDLDGNVTTNNVDLQALKPIEVNTFADLPSAAANTGETYHVLNATGTWILNTRRRSGLYRSNGTSWIERHDVSSLLVDNEFNIRDDVDNTKGVRFVLDNLSTGLIRSVIFPDKDLDLRSTTNLITVGKDGNVDFVDDVAGAVAAATALVPSDSNRVAIVIYPGEYTEAPLTIPDYVDIFSQNAKLVPSNNTSDFLTIGDFSLIKNLKLECPVTSGYGVVMGESTLSSCSIISGANGIRMTGAGGKLSDVNYLTNLTGVGLQSDLTGVEEVFVKGCIIKGGTIGVESTNTGGINLFSSSILADTVAGTGIVIRGGTFIDIQGVTIEDEPNRGVFVENTGQLTGNSLIVDDFATSIITHLETEAGATVNINSFDTNGDKFIIADWTGIDLQYNSTFVEGDSISKFVKELWVGDPRKGAESVFGEGDSTSEGMLVFTNNATGTNLTDVTDAAKSTTGSTFGFQNNALDEVIYMASDNFNNSQADYVKFFGFKVNVDTILTQGAGGIVCEYWNGVSWTSFNFMVTQSDDPFLPKAQDIFQEPSEQVRFNSDIGTDWTKNDPIISGTDRFWVRLRLTGAVTQLPLLEKLKLHTNRFEINDAGWPEMFGKARSVGKLPFDVNFFQAANSSPANQDVYLGDNLGVGRLENEFVDGATDRVGMNFYLPFDLDTSCPIRLRLTYITQGNSAGDINWNIRWSISTDGDSVFATAAQAPGAAPGEQLINLVDPAPTQFVQKTIEFDLDISDAISRRSGAFGDLIWVSIERLGGSGPDTHGDNVALVQLAPYYTKWCDGGHQ